MYDLHVILGEAKSRRLRCATKARPTRRLGDDGSIHVADIAYSMKMTNWD
jgi:hypothetical protein